MSHVSSTPEFQPLPIAVLTVSDSRRADDDVSGDTLVAALLGAGHRLADRRIVIDDRYQIRAALSAWIADPGIVCVLVTGGTGITGRDITPEALTPLLDREIPGFGELFRQVSMQEIGSAAMQSRALAGCANGTLVFALPGSPGACRTAWNQLLGEQLDARTRPCNFVALLPRLRE
jgi:molybdopterin adenylyltransferase